MYKKISVFDFDGCLFDTPIPDEGKKIWKKKKGVEYPHVGWWGRKESLDIHTFNIKPYPLVLNQINDDINNSVIFTVLLTSRIEHLRYEIESILSSFKIIPDKILLKQAGKEKNIRVQELIDQMPSVNQIDVYDDREKEFVVYRQLKEKNPNKEINIFKVDAGNISLI